MTFDDMTTPPQSFSIAALRERACPISTPPWPDSTPVREFDIRLALEGKIFRSEPLGPLATTPDIRAARIAWLIQYDWFDPIELDFGVPGYPGYDPTRWIVEDGNHRLCAAIISGRDTILANASGLQSEIDAFLA